MKSEYVCYPNLPINHPLQYSRIGWVRYALDSIISPSESLLDTHLWYQTGLAQGTFVMRDWVAGSFYRLEFDSKSKIGKMPPCRDPEMKRQKKLVDACGLLWAKTWRVLERMESMGKLPLPPFALVSAVPQQAIIPLWLMALVVEGELLTPWLDYLSPDGSSGFEAFRKQQQGDNRKIQNLENPFENPCTRLFIDSAIATADKFDQFRKHFYNPMVRQRQSITAFVVKERFMAFDLDGKPSRQGRREKT